MTAVFAKVIQGDMTAFSKLYADVYKKIYYVAHYSLANSVEAVDAVTDAARCAYENAKDCSGEEEIKEMLLKKTCEQIIVRFREYRKIPPAYEPQPPFIKSQMLRLTDAERLSVMVWSVFGYEAEKISSVTGLALEVVEKKLESGQAKLVAKL